MGFYGNISNSNKSVFTFDRVYGNRFLMDESINSDGVFLGRYVLVEYDDTPISIWPKEGTNTLYTDVNRYYSVESTGGWKTNQLYKLEEPAPWQNLEAGFYYRDARTGRLTPTDDRLDGPYAYNYQIDVQQYGRGYDGTVWRKTYDTAAKKYRYVMLAELNAAVPSFHLVARAPSDGVIPSPVIDTSDSTNLNYYMFFPTEFYNRFNESAATVGMPIAAYQSTNGETVPAHTVYEYENITQYVPRWGMWDTTTHTQTYEKAYVPQTVDIFYNKLGFEPTYHQTNQQILHQAGGNVNEINYSMVSSGRQYDHTPSHEGETKNDTKLWYIHLPGIGNAIHQVYDTLYGFKNNGREVTNWLKTSLSADKVYDMKTVVGAINHIQDILGYNFEYVTAAPTPVTKTTADNNLYFVGNAGSASSTQSQRSAVQHIYYYRKVPDYTQNNNGEYYRTSDGVYRVANKDTTLITPAERYSVSYHYERTELVTDVHQGLFGMFIDLQRRLGISEDNDTNFNKDNSRDPNTIQGMINRAGDMLSYLDTGVARNRLVFTNEDGVFMTADGTKTIDVTHSNHGSGTVDTIFPLFNTPDNTKTLSAEGIWVNRLGSMSVTNSTSVSADLTRANGIVTVAASAQAVGNNRINLTTENQWIIMARDDTADVKKIKWAHKLNGLTTARYKANGDNKPWLKYNSDSNSIELGPWVQSVSDWTSGATIDDEHLSQSQLNIPSYTFDAAGHMIGYANYEFYLPHSFKTITNIIDTNSGSKTASVTETASTIIADTATDTLTFTTGNIWLDIIGETNGDEDKFIFAHHLNGLDKYKAASVTGAQLAYDSTNNTIELGPWLQADSNWTMGAIDNPEVEESNDASINLSKSQINIPSYTFDAAGHMVNYTNYAFYLPHSFKTIKNIISNNASSNSNELTETAAIAIADHATDTITFATGNKWIDIYGDATNDEFIFGHHLNGLAAIYKASGAAKPWLSYNSTNNAIELGPWIQDASDWVIDHDDIATADKAAASERLNKSELNIPSYTFDAAGHMINYKNYKFYLPHVFKSFSVTNSSAVTSSTATAGTIIADTATDLLSFATANKWIQIAADPVNDEITFGHVLTHTTVTANTAYGLTADTSIATLDANNSFKVPEFTVDEAGHVIAAATHTVTLPENFETILIGANITTEATAPVASIVAHSVVADSLVDTLTLKTGNKWLIYDTDTTNDVITIYHATVTAATTTATIDLNSQGTFNTQEITCDGAGHVTANKITTHTLPYNWKTITVENSNTASTIVPTASTISATTQVDTVKFNAINKWIQLNAADKTVNVAHMLSDLTSGAHASSWTLAAQTPSFGASFNILIPSISFTTDEAGHVTAYSYGSSTSTVTLPSCSVTDTIADGNVVTGLSVVGSTGVFTTSRNNIGALALTGYESPADTNDTILASDTLNAAIGRLVTRISAEETANTEAHEDFDDRLDTLESDLGADDTEGERLRVKTIEDDYILSDDLSDAIDQAKEDVIDEILTAIRNNYTLTLIAPVVIASYSENGDGVISFTITNTDGTLSISLEKNEEGQWNTVTVPAPVEAPYSYTVPNTSEINGNGSYRIKVQRTYNNQMVEGISNIITIDDLPDLTPPDEPENPPDEPENPEEPEP